MWKEPKTDWKVTDYFNYVDYNRIKNNIDHIHSMALDMYLPFLWADMGDDKTSYSDFPYADEFNAIEENLRSIQDSTYAFFNIEKKTWYENQRTPTFEDFNRIEQACLAFYNGFTKQATTLVRLPLKLGLQKGMVR